MKNCRIILLSLASSHVRAALRGAFAPAFGPQLQSSGGAMSPGSAESSHIALAGWNSIRRKAKTGSASDATGAGVTGAPLLINTNAEPSGSSGWKEQLITTGGSSVATKDVMSLDSVRSTLIRQEDSIIFALIERAQFRQNRAIYHKGILPLRLDIRDPDYKFLSSLSFLEYMLLETEKVHAKVRRYTSPEEHAFFPDQLPQPVLTPLEYPALLTPNTVGANAEILTRYVHEVVPAICKPGDDEQHGSSVLADITVLQAISKRIHLGKFVAETKFQEDGNRYTKLVTRDDVEGVMETLTHREVEARVLQRAELKASTYGQDVMGEGSELKVEPAVIAAIYRDLIIPLTKQVEVLYLFQRVGREPPRHFTERCQGRYAVSR